MQSVSSPVLKMTIATIKVGGEAEGEGLSVVAGHRSPSCRLSEDHPPADRSPRRRTENCNHRVRRSRSGAQSVTDPTRVDGVERSVRRRGRAKKRAWCSATATKIFHDARTDCSSFAAAYDGDAHAPPNRQTGMPSFLALSARLPWMPVPGKTMTPIGSTSSIWSLRLNGAARPCFVQSGAKPICGTPR